MKYVYFKRWGRKEVDLIMLRLGQGGIRREREKPESVGVGRVERPCVSFGTNW